MKISSFSCKFHSVNICQGNQTVFESRHFNSQSENYTFVALPESAEWYFMAYEDLLDKLIRYDNLC